MSTIPYRRFGQPDQNGLGQSDPRGVDFDVHSHSNGSFGESQGAVESVQLIDRGIRDRAVLVDDEFTCPVVLMGRAEKSPVNPRAVRHEPIGLAGLGRNRERLPGKLKAGHVRRDAVVRTAQVERVRAIEPR